MLNNKKKQNQSPTTTAKRGEPSCLSSRHVLRGHTWHVLCPQRHVHRSDQFVDVCTHLRRVGVVLQLPQARALEVTVLLALHAEQAVLGHHGTQEQHHGLELGEEVPFQVLEVNHVDVPAVAQPVKGVGRPPRSIVLHKLWPLWGIPRERRGKSTVKDITGITHGWRWIVLIF